jgi:putative (di)nucleoside polyphosphate hydrolase
MPMSLSDSQIEALPYRPCVGVMLLNRDGLIFAGQRIDNPSDAWQMPQGGIDPGENPRDAALRELGEEVGLDASRIEVLRESAVWLPYDLPRALVPRLWQGRFRGQTQRWFAMRYLGPDEAIDIRTAEPEFRAWAWMRHDDLAARIVPFKRDIYNRVFDEFADLIGTPARRV